MGAKEGWKNQEGGYVFISHSHKDIGPVRRLRNYLEENGFDPLCFYLRCLTDNDEVEGLIKREIDAREWFVYVDSPNARASAWVQKERAYIEKTGTKKILSFSLEEAASLEDQAARIMRSMRVFLSYSFMDRETADRLRQELVRRDLQVFWPEEVPLGEDLYRKYEENLKAAAEKGCMVILLTENSMRSRYAEKEIAFFYKQNRGGLMIPVLAGEPELSEFMRYFLADQQMVKMGKDPSREDIIRAADAVESALEKGFHRMPTDCP